MTYNSLEELPIRFKESITEAVAIILSYEIQGIMKIILFGSCARLDICARSDVDIAVVLQEQLTDRRISGGLRSDIDQLGNGMDGDLVILSEESFNSEDNRLVNNIKKEGIVLWEGGVFTDDYKQLLLCCTR